MKGWSYLLLCAETIGANVHAQPRALRLDELSGFEEVLAEDVFERRQHPGEKVEIVCNAATKRLTDCHAVGESAAWSTSYPGHIARRVRVSSSVTGPVSLKFRVPTP